MLIIRFDLNLDGAAVHVDRVQISQEIERKEKTILFFLATIQFQRPHVTPLFIISFSVFAFFVK